MSTIQPSNFRLMRYQAASAPVTPPAPAPSQAAGGAVSPAAAYPHLFGGFSLDQARAQLLALQAEIQALIQRLSGTPSPTPAPGPAPGPTPTPAPATGAGSLSVDRLRSGNFAGCLFGSTTPGVTADSVAGKFGRQLDINHSYYRVGDTVPSAEDKADVAAGRIPFISYNAVMKNGQQVKWADIASGKYDAQLRQMAQGIKSLGKPVFFCFNHEPENDQVRGTPADYKAAWAHVSQILAQEGATNAVKTYVCMGWKPELAEQYYPGNNVVDWIGGDPYNWAFTASHPTAAWKPFSQVITKFHDWARTKGKPIMIAETGCVEDPKDPNRKAQWLRDMGNTLKNMPDIKGLMYFNNNMDPGQGTNGWRVETPQALAAMKGVAQDPYFARH